MKQRKVVYSKVAGVSFGNRQAHASQCRSGEKLIIVRDSENQYDANAVAIYSGFFQIGFLNKDMAATIAPKIDANENVECYVEQVTGGGDFNIGVNIRLEFDEFIVEENNKSTEQSNFDDEIPFK